VLKSVVGSIGPEAKSSREMEERDQDFEEKSEDLNTTLILVTVPSCDDHGGGVRVLGT